MYEKVNPYHPDKIADRIAGALVDYAYTQEHDPRIAVEVLVGHGICTVIIESNVDFSKHMVDEIVKRITGQNIITLLCKVKQNSILAKNQEGKIKCGDNGIFKGVPLTEEEKELSKIARKITNKWPHDGKYVINKDKLIICQSNASTDEIAKEYPGATVNPLGYWTGGVNVDSGATNRKLGSDMGGSVTGGGLHGKDLSKADVSVNIYAFLKAQETGREVNLCCAIGDEYIDGKPYSEVVEIAREYIKNTGGFEKFAEWGLI